MKSHICLLHCNKLPVRHIGKDVDGITTVPQNYTWNLGENLDNYEQSHMLKFDPIDFTLIEASEEEKYILKIYRAVATSFCLSKLAHVSPWKISHFRWLTTASWILRLGILLQSPNENFKNITKFVMKVKVFKIKLDHQNYLAAECFLMWYALRKQKKLWTVLQCNCYFAHSWFF